MDTLLEKLLHIVQNESLKQVTYYVCVLLAPLLVAKHLGKPIKQQTRIGIFSALIVKHVPSALDMVGSQNFFFVNGIKNVLNGF